MRKPLGLKTVVIVNQLGNSEVCNIVPLAVVLQHRMLSQDLADKRLMPRVLDKSFLVLFAAF